MGTVLITLKIMPDSPQSDLSKIKKEAESKINSLGGRFNGSKEEPIAFGLKALGMSSVLVFANAKLHHSIRI